MISRSSESVDVINLSDYRGTREKVALRMMREFLDIEGLPEPDRPAAFALWFAKVREYRYLFTQKQKPE